MPSNSITDPTTFAMEVVGMSDDRRSRTKAALGRHDLEVMRERERLLEFTDIYVPSNPPVFLNNISKTNINCKYKDNWTYKDN